MFDWFAKKLLDTLEGMNALAGRSSDCARARTQIPALIKAEAAGADADDIPEFAELLAHLGTCEACAEEYRRQSTAAVHLPDTELAALADALNAGENIAGTWMEDALAHCAVCTSCAADLARVRGAR